MKLQTTLKKVKFGPSPAYRYMITDLDITDKLKAIKAMGFASDRKDCELMASDAVSDIKRLDV